MKSKFSVAFLSRCFLDCSVGVGVFVTGLSQISSFFSIDDDERPGRPTEIGDAIIDDIRHVVQEGGHAPFLSFSSLGIHRALKRSNFCFSVKIVCIVDMDKSKPTPKFPLG